MPPPAAVHASRRNSTIEPYLGIVLRGLEPPLGLQHRQTSPRQDFTLFEGTSEIQRMIIGRAVTGLDVLQPDLTYGGPGGRPGPFPAQPGEFTFRVAYEVAVRSRDGSVRVEVTDRGGPGAPDLLPADHRAEGGRGLQLNASIAVRWGWQRRGGRTVTWFELSHG